MSHHSDFQTSLQYSVHCHGVALHSGETVSLTLRPAPADHGIMFKRTDVPAHAALIPARYDLVTDTRLGTTLTNAHGTKVMTVEHLMAALWGCGVDNALIELEGPEIPIMDGSSEPFVFLVECAGIETLDAPRRVLELQRTVSVQEGQSVATAKPAAGFELDITIQFSHAQIGTQHACYDFEQVSFKQALCRARTFGFAHEVEYLRSIGLARGGSLANAIVLDEKEVLNRDGLRFNNEFVRHKALDCVGDYFLAGGHLRGAITTTRPGHGINNQLLRAIFADASNYRWVTLAPQLPNVAAMHSGSIAANYALAG